MAHYETVLMVPPAGIEPALPEEPHFECGASTNSAKGASIMPPYHGPDTSRNEAGAGNEEPKVATTRPEQLSIHMKDGPRLWEANWEAHERSRHLRNLWLEMKLPFGWGVEFLYDTRGYWYLQVVDVNAIDNVTGAPTAWRGRKWLLSDHMTDGEIVQTAFKAILTAVEHEVRETFLYKGAAIFDPHYDIEKLVELRKRPDALKERDPMPPANFEGLESHG